MTSIFQIRGKGLATTRLGKTSVEAIRSICNQSPGIQQPPYEFQTTCTQVPTDLEPRALALIWLGSDNSKGTPTPWKQGFRAIGRIVEIERSGEFRDETTLSIAVGYVMKEAINKVDLLREAPDEYYLASNMPVIGIADNANQTVRIIDENEAQNDIRALFQAFEKIQSGLIADVCSVYPELSSVKDFVLPAKGSSASLPPTAGKCGFGYGDILAAIRTKPFVLLAGISGTGKSRMVRELAKGCCPAESELWDEQRPKNFEMVQVRPNWHDSAELLGYVTRVTGDGKPQYVVTDFVKFLAKAWLHLEVPFFLCLDEMNLAPVEQYFAEYLSVVETRRRDGKGVVRTDPLVRLDGEIRKETLDRLYEKDAHGAAEELIGRFEEEGGIPIPPNLVVIGTVNMDETTFSFSRKVLDRAMSFELCEVDLNAGLAESNEVAAGAIPREAVAQRLVSGREAYAEDAETCGKVKAFLERVNGVLEGTPFKTAYRTRDEMMIYCIERMREGNVPLAQALDEAASMKILSRVEGDRQREGTLKALGEAIRMGLDEAGDGEQQYTVCTRKVEEMQRQLRDGGYTSFWTR